MEFAAIKCLMSRPYSREQIVGAEVLGGHHAKPDCGIWQCAMEASQFFVCEKRVEFDQDFASIELGL